MTDREINGMKYYICCPWCDLEKCVKGTDECEAEEWAAAKRKEEREKQGGQTMAELKDSGNRTKFASGAVRDIQEGKGRCDLLPFRQTATWLNDSVLDIIGMFMLDKNTERIYSALDNFVTMIYPDSDPLIVRRSKAVLEVAKHFEDGAKKYGDRNWEKGIPISRFIDSGVRHYLKWKAGWTDEPHDRAFIWNMLCMIWTYETYGWIEEKTEEKSASDAESNTDESEYATWAEVGEAFKRLYKRLESIDLIIMK